MTWASRVLSLALVLTLSLPAYAEPTAAERETARTLLFSGRDKRKAGKLKEALSDLEKAHAIMKVPTTGLELGKAQKDLGLLVEARATLLEASHAQQEANEPKAFKAARKEAKDLADELGPRLATLTLVVTDGTVVKMDDAELAAAAVAAPLKVNPGKHEIVASLGGAEKQASIELAEGQARTVELKLPPPKDAPTPPTAKKKDPSSSDGPGVATAEKTETSTLVWVGGGVAAVGVAVGAATGLLALSAKNDVAAQCTTDACPQKVQADIDSGQLLGNISTVGFVVAVIGGGLLVYGLLNPTKVTTTTTGLTARGYVF